MKYNCESSCVMPPNIQEGSTNLFTAYSVISFLSLKSLCVNYQKYLRKKIYYLAENKALRNRHTKGTQTKLNEMGFLLSYTLSPPTPPIPIKAIFSAVKKIFSSPFTPNRYLHKQQIFECYFLAGEQQPEYLGLMKNRAG